MMFAISESTVILLYWHFWWLSIEGGDREGRKFIFVWILLVDVDLSTLVKEKWTEKSTCCSFSKVLYGIVVNGFSWIDSDRANDVKWNLWFSSNWCLLHFCSVFLRVKGILSICGCVENMSSLWHCEKKKNKVWISATKMVLWIIRPMWQDSKWFHLDLVWESKCKLMKNETCDYHLIYFIILS